MTILTPGMKPISLRVDAEGRLMVAGGGGGGTAPPVLYATIPATAVASPGKRQAVGGSKAVTLSAAAYVSVYVKWSDASGALSVSTGDTLYAITPAASVTITVPAGFPFLEYMLASGGPLVNIGLLA